MEYYIKEKDLLNVCREVRTLADLQALCDYINIKVRSDFYCMGLSNQAEAYLRDCDCYFEEGECFEIEGAEELIEIMLNLA